MNRFFAFLYVEDEAIAPLLNTAIVVLNPRAKWPAHVTVAGPFTSRKQLPRKLAYYRSMSVFGVGQFRSETQNTVFLRVGTFDLRRVTKKPDYGFNPHITLYDGQDHELGDELYRQLRSSVPFMRLHVSRLHLVESGSPQRDMHFWFDRLDAEFVKDFGLTWSAIEGLTAEDRILIATSAIRRAVHASKGEADAVTSALGSLRYRPPAHLRKR
jgi:hypothetical protein